MTSPGQADPARQPLGTKPKNLDELWEACKTAFFAIPDDFINKLYESLPNRMDAVLQAHGSHTRY